MRTNLKGMRSLAGEAYCRRAVKGAQRRSGEDGRIFRSVDPAKADTLRVGVTQDFEAVAIESGNDGTSPSRAANW